MKKIFLALIIIFLNSCGYTPLYSSKESNYKVISFKKNLNNSLTNYIQNSIEVLDEYKTRCALLLPYWSLPTPIKLLKSNIYIQ